MSDRETAAAWGRIGGLTAWAHNDAETMTGAAHRGFRARFEREVDPEGILPPAERAARAERARRAWMLTLAARSAAVRRSKATAEVQSPAVARGGRHATADDPTAA
jgi:hypothetical protein